MYQLEEYQLLQLVAQDAHRWRALECKHESYCMKFHLISRTCFRLRCAGTQIISTPIILKPAENPRSYNYTQLPITHRWSWKVITAFSIPDPADCLSLYLFHYDVFWENEQMCSTHSCICTCRSSGYVSIRVKTA